MRKVNKPSLVPDKLIQAQNEIAAKLFEKKGNFSWQSEHYNTPIKEELKTLYHNKCAFCETIFTNDFSVEHFRPKSIYYWLGNEWTNLFPLCITCNNKKGNEFPTARLKVRNPPFDNNGKLDRVKCLVTYEELLNEQPLYIHPEIEDGKEYFYFNTNGKIQIQANLSLHQKRQAEKMEEILKLPTLEEKRKKIVADFQQELRNDVIDFLRILQSDMPTDREIKLAFRSFFRRLWQRQAAEAEYSLLGLSMLAQFDSFFLSEYENDVKELVQYAFELFNNEYNN